MSSHYLPLKVAEITRETTDAVTIHFEHPEQKLIPYLPGQFLTLLLSINGTKVRRAYSLSSIPADQPRLSVTVKRVKEGLVSHYLCSILKEGDTVEVMEPMGHFTLETNPAHNRIIYLFGAGSGITPLISMARAVLREEPGSRVVLIYGNRDQNSIIFKKQLDQMVASSGGRFLVEHVLSQPQGPWAGFTGRMNRSMVLKILDRLNLPPLFDTQYFLCGPEGMMQEVKEALKLLRVPAERIHKESFVNTLQDTPSATGEVGAKEDGGQNNAHLVTIQYEGAEYKLEVAPDQTILEAALDQDIDLPFSCQSGLCTACRGKCLSGKVHLDEREGLSDAEIEEGYVLTCVGHPRTEGVVIEIG
jgi:ring-1,2-phenylacetyl-CoA epoxidase subunit PaaE